MTITTTRHLVCSRCGRVFYGWGNSLLESRQPDIMTECTRERSWCYHDLDESGEWVEWEVVS